MIHSLLRCEMKQRYVTILNDNDVLLGRGSRRLENEGNVRFRNIVKQRKKEYSTVERRSRKDEIAREIVAVIESLNGRFLRNVNSKVELRKLRVPYGSDMDDIWVLADEGAVLLKVKQAFRNCEEPNSDDSSRAALMQSEGTKKKSSAHSKEVSRENPLVSSLVETNTSPQVDLGNRARTNESEQTHQSGWPDNVKYNEIHEEKRSKIETGSKRQKKRCKDIDTYENTTLQYKKTKVHHASLSSFGERLYNSNEPRTSAFNFGLNEDKGLGVHGHQIPSVLQRDSEKQCALLGQSGINVGVRGSILSESSCHDQLQALASLTHIGNARLDMIQKLQVLQRTRDVGYEVRIPQHGSVGLQKFAAMNFEQSADTRPLATALQRLQKESYYRQRSSALQNYIFERARLLNCNRLPLMPLATPTQPANARF